MKNLKKYAVYAFICGAGALFSGQLYAAKYAMERFESDINDPTIGGSDRTLMGIWYDGGTGASLKTTEAFSGSRSMGLDPLKPVAPDYLDNQHNYIDVDTASGKEYVKKNYGSIYTKSIDFSQTTSANLRFRYLVTNSFGYDATSGDFKVEISKDGGETFEVLMVPNELAPIKSTSGSWIADQKAACGDDVDCKNAAQAIYTGGTIPAADRAAYWSSQQRVDIPEEYLRNNVVLRIKSYYKDDVIDDKSKAYLDNVVIFYDGTAPVLSEDVVMPTNDAVAAGRSFYSASTFDTDDAEGWGIWTDGGRNAYTSAFLAEEGTGNVVLRDRYREGVSNGPGLGDQKPTYSSILTANTDFSRVKELQVEFSFVAYGIGISDVAPTGNGINSTYFRLSISTNAGVDYTPVETWEAGKDYIDSKRYNVVKTITEDMIGSLGLTTSTIIKIQAFGRDETDQIYIDNLAVYTIGQRASQAGTPVNFNSENASISLLQADSAVSTYDLINSTWIDNYDPTNFEGASGEVDTFPCIYGAVEHTDDTHAEFGEHITQAYDADLGKDVFSFHVHQSDHSEYIDDDNRAVATPDTDRCRTDGDYDDRQRVEVKTYSESPATLLGVKGETHMMSWKMKLPADFAASDKFTHLHQLKPVGGPGAKMPLITLTAVGAKEATSDDDTPEPAKLNLRYSPSTVSQITITSAPLEELMGKWVHIVEKVTFGLEGQGRYEILILDAANLEAAPIMQFSSYSLPTWKIDDEGEFIRGKWGVYRSIVQGDKLKDEEVKFADIMIAEVTGDSAEFSDLLSFAYYANTLAGGSAPTTPISEGTEFLGTSGADIITVSQGSSVNVTVSVNGEETVLSPLEARSIILKGQGGADTITVDPDVYYGNLTIYGGGGKDIIIGGNGNDKLYGEGGSDIIIGRAGDDYIDGGNGTDNLAGGFGVDTYVDNSTHNNRVYTGAGDTVSSGSNFFKQTTSYTAMNVAGRREYLDTILEHLENYKYSSDTISLEGNTNYSNTELVFLGTQDVNDEVEGSEVYSFSISASLHSQLEEDILDYEATGSADSLAKINNRISGDPSIYTPYVLWRLGALSVGEAKFTYDNYVLSEMAANGYSTIRYVGETYFAFDDLSETWYSTQALSDSNDGSVPVTCATDGTCTQLEADLQGFSDWSVDTTIPINASYYLAVDRVFTLGDYELTSQVADPVRAADTLLSHWGQYGQGSSVNFAEIQQSLGYTPNTTDSKIVANTQTNADLRGALAYLLSNTAFFNAVDGSGVSDGLISYGDIEDFINNTKDDIATAYSWYEEQDNSNKYNEIKNQYMVALISNHRIIEAAVSEVDGQFTLADAIFFRDSTENYSLLLREASAFIANNSAIFARLDTGSNVFSWYNRPNDLVTKENIMSAAPFIGMTPDDLLSHTTQSLMLRAFRGDISVDEGIRRNIGDILMAWDGYELIASDPDNVFVSSKIPDLQLILDSAMNNALNDQATADWLADNLNTEFDRWLAEGSLVREDILAYMVNDLGYYGGDDEVDAYAQSLLESNGNNLSEALIQLQGEVQPLTFNPDFSERYTELVEEVGYSMLFIVAGSEDVDTVFEDAAIEAILEYLVESEVAGDSIEVRKDNIAKAVNLVRHLARLYKNIPKILTHWDKLAATSYMQAQDLGEWKVMYDKGYLHAASAVVTAGAMAARIVEGDLSDPKEIGVIAALTTSLTSDLTTAGNRLRKASTVLSDVIVSHEAFLDNLKLKPITNADMIARNEPTLAALKARQAKELSIAGKFAIAGDVLSAAGGGYFAYLSITSAQDAFDTGNVVLGVLYSMEATATAVGSIATAVEVMATVGIIGAGAGSVASLAAAGSSIVGSSIMVALIIYEMVQWVQYYDKLQEFRQEAEQVFRPSVVNDGASSWTDAQQDKWYEGSFNRGPLYSFNDKSSELDDIFNVDHPAGSSDTGTVD